MVDIVTANQSAVEQDGKPMEYCIGPSPKAKPINLVFLRAGFTPKALDFYFLKVYERLLAADLVLVNNV